MRSIYEIRNQESICEEFIASHRDPSILNGTLVIETPNKEMEQESWEIGRNKYKKNNISWINIENHKVKNFIYRLLHINIIHKYYIKF